MRDSETKWKESGRKEGVRTLYFVEQEHTRLIDQVDRTTPHQPFIRTRCPMNPNTNTIYRTSTGPLLVVSHEVQYPRALNSTHFSHYNYTLLTRRKKPATTVAASQHLHAAPACSNCVQQLCAATVCSNCVMCVRVCDGSTYTLVLVCSACLAARLFQTRKVGSVQITHSAFHS